MKISRWEINHAIDLLEREGYLIRRPSEALLPVTLEAIPHPRSPFEILVRADAVLNGKTCALSQSFPCDMVLNPDDDSFRKEALPKIMSRALGQFMADGLAASISDQVASKIEPLVPEKQMSLTEIESYLAWALRDCRAEGEEPK